MTYRQMKWMILVIPTATVGIWEYIRHQWLMPYLSMSAGNWLTPVILFVVSITLLSRLFTLMESARAELEQERAAKNALEARERLADELHDGIAQSLFLLSVKIDRAERSEAQTAGPRDWDGIRKTIHEVDRYVRQAITDLRTDPLAVLSTAQPSIRERILKLAADVYPQTTVDWHIADTKLTAREQVELLACIREALLNVRKHAQAEQAYITGTDTNQGWLVSVEDNGIGYEGNPLMYTDRHGLRIMQERSERLGWQFAFEHKNGRTLLKMSKEVAEL